MAARQALYTTHFSRNPTCCLHDNLNVLRALGSSFENIGGGCWPTCSRGPRPKHHESIWECTRPWYPIGYVSEAWQHVLSQLLIG
ncbi:hypothetical protein OG21DRAFT_1513250 [Imleria badia]|nr:hypothetical protein OG21DRAFT_1513250 [Imleria badia]